jgi:hypothetical protein
MRPMTLDVTKPEALRPLCEQGIADPTRIWEELESRGIHVTPGVIYQAIRDYNRQPRMTEEDRDMGENKGVSLKDVQIMASIAEKAGGIPSLVRLLRTMERVARWHGTGGSKTNVN